MAPNCKFGESGPPQVIRERQFHVRQSQFPFPQTGFPHTETEVPDAAIPVPQFGNITRLQYRLQEIIRFVCGR